ncbi:unnamed protein product [Ranitomeya imitator]|uniref:Adenosine receptor A1 n=1 Tax=Ranitomeya imitator TaxID=111125 RepID=A0ABN9LTH8_9NEOB|nr:unnamed protein product [Ranitomeya imitator]
MDSSREPAVPSLEVTAVTPRSHASSSSRSRQSGSSRKKPPASVSPPQPVPARTASGSVLNTIIPPQITISESLSVGAVVAKRKHRITYRDEYAAPPPIGVEPHIHHCNKRHHVTAHTGRAATLRGSIGGAGYKSVVTARRAVIAITGCWILSFIVGLVPMFGWNNINNLRRQNNSSYGEIVITCRFETVISMEYMVYFNFFVWVLPPLFLMLIIYLEVFNLIQRQLSKKVSSSSKDPQKYYGKELKIAKSLALILFLFALSWLPLHTLNCITLFCQTCNTPMIITYIAIFLTHGNSAMNPIVYAFRIEKFRTTFLYIWKKYFCCKSGRELKRANTTNIERSCSKNVI